MSQKTRQKERCELRSEAVVWTRENLALEKPQKGPASTLGFVPRSYSTQANGNSQDYLKARPGPGQDYAGW